VSFDEQIKTRIAEFEAIPSGEAKVDYDTASDYVKEA